MRIAGVEGTGGLMARFIPFANLFFQSRRRAKKGRREVGARMKDGSSSSDLGFR